LLLSVNSDRSCGLHLYRHAILRGGLRNLSNTDLMTCGAVYGAGIYLSPCTISLHRHLHCSPGCVCSAGGGGGGGGGGLLIGLAAVVGITDINTSRDYAPSSSVLWRCSRLYDQSLKAVAICESTCHFPFPFLLAFGRGAVLTHCMNWQLLKTPVWTASPTRTTSYPMRIL